MQKDVLNSLKLEAESDLAKGMLSLKLLTQHPAGIGDHSTGDFWNNSREALDKVADARDRLETLEWIKRTLAEAD